MSQACLEPRAPTNEPSESQFLSALDEFDDDFELPELSSLEINPPSYDAAAAATAAAPRSPPRNFSHKLAPVQPREDEGHEELPAYSTSICLENVFLRKSELEGAVHRAYDRNWWKEYVTLRGTLLTFHRCKKDYFHRAGDAKSQSSPDFPAGTRRGAFLRSYNLQHADVGVAADYVK